MARTRHLDRFTREQIIEAKNYYYDDALKITHSYQQKCAIDFLRFFNIFYDIQEGQASMEDYIEADNKYLWVRNNLNRVEQKIHNYFKLKELGRL